jgi:hypothetical protein
MSDINRRANPTEDFRKHTFFNAVKCHGTQALTEEMAVGKWYLRKKTPIMERKAHYKTMLAVMLLARPPAESQPQPHMWLPVELWDMVTHEFLPPQDHLYAMLTQNGTNEIVMADLEAF